MLSLVSFSFNRLTYVVLPRYDTGTIAGIIAMDDWLQTFGKFDESLGQYLPTKDKSLVVSVFSPS